MEQKSNLIDTFNSFAWDVKSIFNEFAKPILDNVFFLNLSTLRLNSSFVDFTINRWMYRPMDFCLDFYNEPNLYQIVLLVNNIKSFMEFVPDNFTKVDNKRVIVAPYKSEIYNVLNFV